MMHLMKYTEFSFTETSVIGLLVACLTNLGGPGDVKGCQQRDMVLTAP
jgi:hypothetical protein